MLFGFLKTKKTVNLDKNNVPDRKDGDLENVLKIIEYWKFTEFLTQDEATVKEKDLILKFNDFDKMDLNKLNEKVIRDESFWKFGKIQRSVCINKLVENKDIVEKNTKYITWFALKMDEKNRYIENSFELSPILFAIKYKGNDKINSSFLERYKDEKKIFNDSLMNYDEEKEGKLLLEEGTTENSKAFTKDLKNIYEKIYEEYVKDLNSEDTLENQYYCNSVHIVYGPHGDKKDENKDKEKEDLEKAKKEKENDRDTIYNYAKLQNSHFINDLNLISTYLKEQKGKDVSPAFIEYILSLTREEEIKDKRINVGEKSKIKQQEFFKNNINTEKAPLGKWFSKHNPALMQQLAINLAINENNESDIISVNGPPGTGKTTLLKEIIANNIVKRSEILATKENPDDFFKKSSDGFYHLKDDRIKKYGMIVCSSNNSAVENISKELPDGEGVIERIAAILPKGEKDNVKKTYFPEIASEIYNDKKNKECWGMISAVMGNKTNRYNFCDKALKKLLEYYNEDNCIANHRKKYEEAKKEFLDQKKKVEKLLLDINKNKNKNYMEQMEENFYSGDEEKTKKAQMSNFWTIEMNKNKGIEEYNKARELYFYYAIKLNREFILSSKSVRKNLQLFYDINTKNKNDITEPQSDVLESFEFNENLFQTVLLFTPVISSTFASIYNMFKYIDRPCSLGTLIIDEAGQALPHMALGAMFRCRKYVIVGDPKQIEPVVVEDVMELQKNYLKDNEIIKKYNKAELSVQKLADTVNKIGTYIGDDWVGCPLVIHRRCISPMCDIANELSYDNTMKIEAMETKLEYSYIMENSCWINIQGEERDANKKDHFVEKQGKVVYKIIRKYFNNISSIENVKPSLYIISPFTSVVDGIKSYIEDELKKEEKEKKEIRNKILSWLKDKNIGTVHTFQGKEAMEVIFLLGCSNGSAGAVKWVNRNIVNVAATRAKNRFYIIGDYNVWKINDVMKITMKNIENVVLGCPSCSNGYMVKRKKREDMSEFYGCTNYGSNEKCRYTMSISDHDEMIDRLKE